VLFDAQPASTAITPTEPSSRRTFMTRASSAIVSRM
jgi:hypothetical protein